MRGTLSVTILALSLLTVAVPSVSAQSTLVVDDDGNECPDRDHAGIQAAVDAAFDDTTIEVCAGTYEESLFVEDLDGLTVEGAGSDEVTIDVPADTGRDIDVGGNPGAHDQDIRLAGFTLLGSDDFGIKAAFIDGLTVEDVHVEGSERTGLDVNTVDDVEIADVTSAANDANGIAVRNADTVAISDVATEGNAWGGLAFYAPGGETVQNVQVSDSQFENEPAGLYLQYEGYTDVRIEGSSFTGNGVGLAVDDSFGGPPEADEVTVRHSSFEDNDAGVTNDAQVALDARENWWGSPLGPSHADNPFVATGQTGDSVGDDVDFTPWCLQPGCPVLTALP